MLLVVVLALFAALAYTADGGRWSPKPQDLDKNDDSYLEVYSCNHPRNKHIHVFTQKHPKTRFPRPRLWPKHSRVVVPKATNVTSPSTNDQDDIASRLLFIGGERVKVSRRFKISDVQFEICDKREDDPFQIKQFRFLEDAVVPGDVVVEFDVQLDIDVDHAIKVEVEAFKQILGAYVRMPCYNDLGSCTYQDMCEASHYSAPCPEDFQKAGIPCTCPLPKGSYKTDRLTVYAGVTDTVDIPSWLTDGHYMLEIKVSSNDQRLTCIRAEANIAQVTDDD